MLDFLLFAVSGIIGLLVIIIVYYFYKPENNDTTSSTNTKGAKAIPGWDRPPADQQSGDLSELSKHGSLHQYLLFLHNNGRNPIAMFWWGNQRVVSVCSPELFKDTVRLTYRPELLFKLFEPMLGTNSIQYANGLDWEERRKWLYATLRGKSLEEYMPIFIKIANETADIWRNLSSDKAVDLQEEFFTMTIKGISRTCFGNVFNDDAEIRGMAHTYRELWDEMEQRLHIGDPQPGSDRDKTFKSSLQSLRNRISRIVDDRRSGIIQEDIPFIDALLQSGVPQDQIMSDAITFMVGGLHTSGYLLLWTVHFLTLHDAILDKLVLEMEGAVGTDQGAKLQEYAQNSDTFLRSVLDETLRLSVLAPYAARYCDHDIVAGGYLIPAGTPIVHALGVSLKNECVWTDVNKFDPSHVAPGGLQGKDTMAFAPFGHGRRKCPGYMFSYAEVGIFLTILLQQFVVKPVGGAKPLEPVHGLVTSPKETLSCYITARATES